MLRTTDSSIPVFRSPLLDPIPGVWHAFTTRNGGISRGPFATLNLSTSVGDDPEAVRENRMRLAALTGVDPSLVTLQVQVHGVTVVVLGEERLRGPATGDAFVTDRAGIPLLVGVADCAAVLLAAENGSVVAVAHAGWRGAAAGVIRATVDALSQHYGIAPDRLYAAIGPAIGPCCFEVSQDVASQFSPANVRRSGGARPHVDLPGALAADLTAAGIPPEHVDRADLCTRCHPELFFSHRGSGGQTGRMVGMILRT